MPDATPRPKRSDPQLLAFVAIAVAAVVFYAPSLINGLPIGDSYLFNISWALAFDQALSTSTPYPRWLGSLWAGAGAADFYFYGPLPFYIVSGVQRLCGECGVETSITLSAILLRVFAGLTTYRLARDLGAGRWSIVAALLVVLGPYQVINWWHRQALGELTGSAFIPLVLLMLYRTLHGISVRYNWTLLTVAVALVSLSHLPSAMIAAVTSAVLIMTVWRPKHLWPAVLASSAAVLGLALSAIYWMPAISLLETVDSGALWNIGLAFMNLAFWEWDVREGMLWAPFVVLSILALAVSVVMWAPRAVLARTVVAVLLLCWLVILPIFQPIWQATPISAIQFPWRFLTIAEIATGLALAGALSVAGTRLRQLVGMVAATVIALPLILWFQAPAKRTDYPWALDIRLGPIEWLAKGHGADFLEMQRTGPPARLRGTTDAVVTATSGAELTIEQDTPRRVAFTANCPTGCQVAIHRGFWKFWDLTNSEGHAVPISMTAGFPLISADLPPGQRSYQLILTRPRSEIIGGVVSAIALMTLLGILVCAALLARRRRAPRSSS